MAKAHRTTEQTWALWGLTDLPDVWEHICQDTDRRVIDAEWDRQKRLRPHQLLRVVEIERKVVREG